MNTRPFKRLRFLLEYAVTLPLFWGVRIMPRRALSAIAYSLGSLVYMLPRNRHVMLANLAVAFPEKPVAERRRIARRSVGSIILSFFELCHFVRRPDRLMPLVEKPLETRELADRLTADGSGMIYATPHLGNWEVGALVWVFDTNRPIGVVARTLPNPHLDKLINARRSAGNGYVIPAKGAIRGMLKALGKGHLVATLTDQNTRARDGGIFVDFFGLPVPTTRGPAMFARRMNVPVAVGSCLRTPTGYRMYARELPKPTHTYASDEELSQALMHLMEEVVREHPEQYLWLYRRFQYIPRQATRELAARYPDYAVFAPARFYDRSALKEPVRHRDDGPLPEADGSTG